MTRKLDLTGHVGEYFTVISECAPTRFNCGQRQTTWLCRCNCGREFTATIQRIRSKRKNRVRSCGCMSFVKTDHGNAKVAPPEVTWRSYYTAYKGRATRNGIEWNLSVKRFRDLCQLLCHYCGAKPFKVVNVYVSKGGGARTRNAERCKNAAIVVHGIDRRDPKKGYTPSNCVTACATCNFAKRDMSYHAFIEWLGVVANFRKGCSCG